MSGGKAKRISGELGREPEMTECAPTGASAVSPYGSVAGNGVKNFTGRPASG
jgi:hypothetical protein